MSDQGTLSQIKNLLHRTVVPSDPSENMKGTEDFLLMVLHAHVNNLKDDFQILISR